MHTSITSKEVYNYFCTTVKSRKGEKICKVLRDVVAMEGRCQKPKVHCAKVLCPWEWPRGTAAQGWPTLAAVFWHWIQVGYCYFVLPFSWARWFATPLAAVHSIAHFGCQFHRMYESPAELAFLLVSFRLATHIYAFPRSYQWSTGKKDGKILNLKFKALISHILFGK